MVRRKRELRRIEDTNSRQVTFLKRGSRLLRKAFELSVFCDAEVALIIFSPIGNLCEFSSCSMQSTIDHYAMHEKDIDIKRPSDENMQQMECGSTDLMKKIEILEDYKWKWWCENLETSSIEELHEIEGQLEQSLSKIRQKKACPESHYIGANCAVKRKGADSVGEECIITRKVQGKNSTTGP